MSAPILPKPPTGWANPVFSNLRNAAGQCIPPPPIDNACCNQHAICPTCRTMDYPPYNDLQLKIWVIFECEPCYNSITATGVHPTVDADTHITFQLWDDAEECARCKAVREMAEAEAENHPDDDHEYDEYDKEHNKKSREYQRARRKDPEFRKKEAERLRNLRLKKKSQRQIEEDAMAARQRAAKARFVSLGKPAHLVATKTASVPATKREKVSVSVAKKAPANATSSLSSTKQNTLAYPVTTNIIGKTAHPVATETASALATKKEKVPVSMAKKAPSNATSSLSSAKQNTLPHPVATNIFGKTAHPVATSSIGKTVHPVATKTASALATKKASANMSSSSSLTKQKSPAKSTAEAKSGKKLSLFGTKKK